MKTARLSACLALSAFAASVAHTHAARADDVACINASETALTLRKQGHVRKALEQLAVCADATCPTEIRSDCVQRVDEARGALPTLILAVKDGAGNDVTSVVVTLDGAPLLGALDGRALSLDPGEHTFTFQATGRPSVQKKLVLHEGEKDRRETIVLASPTASTPATTVATAPPPAPGRTWSGSRTLALVAGGLGLVGVGVGSAFGLAASSSQSKEKSDCPAAGCAGHAQAVSDYDDAHRDGIASTIAFGAGAAFLVAGVVLWLTAPDHTEQGATTAHRFRLVPVVGERSGGLVFGGTL